MIYDYVKKNWTKIVMILGIVSVGIFAVTNIYWLLVGALGLFNRKIWGNITKTIEDHQSEVEKGLSQIQKERDVLAAETQKKLNTIKKDINKKTVEELKTEVLKDMDN